MGSWEAVGGSGLEAGALALMRERGAFDGERIELAALGAAMAVCDTGGALLGGTPTGLELLARLGVATDALPAQLPVTLWGQLAVHPAGTPVVCHLPQDTAGACVGCSRYSLGDSHALLVMREITESQQDLARRLHRQRLETTGRLMASLAHDLRTPLTAIVFEIEALWPRRENITAVDLYQPLASIRSASKRLSATIDSLLSFARLGATDRRRVSLAHVFERVEGFVRPMLREGPHELRVHIEPGAEWVRTNALIAEQALVNLVVNATEAALGPIVIEARAERLPAAHGDLVPSGTVHSQDRIRISLTDTGPGIRPSLRERIFEPFFTTKMEGTGLGLPMAREAMLELGGDLRLEATTTGTRFLLWIPTAARSAPYMRAVP